MGLCGSRVERPEFGGFWFGLWPSRAYSGLMGFSLPRE